MAAVERNEVALRVDKWATAVLANQDIRGQVKEPGKLVQLAVSDCDFDNSASGITHTEYLHLRTVWYHYMRNHIESFAGLLKDDKETGYKGFISPQADALATQLMARKSTFLSQYLKECRRTEGDMNYLHPSSQCGYYANVRYWQVMVTAHTKGNNAGGSKIFKPTVRSGNTRPVTPQQQQQHGDVSVSPPQLSQFGSPLRFATPATKSHPPARGTSANSPSADEAYVNTALLLFLQAVTQDFHEQFASLHWVPPRMAMHLKVPVEDARTEKYEDSILLEARVDGYLCDGALEGGLSQPKVICEAKSALRSSIQVATERQEAAEMAAWICHDRGGHGLLQSSASGRKRRLMISQTRDEIWIIVGEYGQAYEEYIRNAPRRAGMSSTNAPPLRYTALARSFEETLGSPTFLDQLVKIKGAGDIQGWEDPVVQTALAKRSDQKQVEQSQRQNRSGGGEASLTSKPPLSGQLHSNSSASSHRGSRGTSRLLANDKDKKDSGDATQHSGRRGTLSTPIALPIRLVTKSDHPRDEDRPVVSERTRKAKSVAASNSRSDVTHSSPGVVASGHLGTSRSPDLPTVDGFLVMHRFGPWKTHDPTNMEVFVRRLLGLMIQLHSAPSRQASSRASK